MKAVLKYPGANREYGYALAKGMKVIEEEGQSCDR